jgi:hypothetical protein
LRQGSACEAGVVSNFVLEEESNGVSLFSFFFCVLREAKDKYSFLVVFTPVFVILVFLEAIDNVLEYLAFAIPAETFTGLVVEDNSVFVIPTETFAGLTDVLIVIVSVIRVVYGVVGGVIVVMSLVFLVLS